MRGVALAPRGELDGEGAFVALGLDHGVRGQLGLDGIECFAELVLDEEHGFTEPLLHGLHDHRARDAVFGECGGVLLEIVEIGGQVEVDVVDRAQLGALAGEREHRRDELLGLELMTQVALVGIGLLRLAALDGAAADHLAAVQELACRGIVELQGRALLEHAGLAQRSMISAVVCACTCAAGSRALPPKKSHATS